MIKNRIIAILKKWWHGLTYRPNITEPSRPKFNKGDLSLNDSILLCYLVEYNRKNELLNNPKYMLLELIGEISHIYDTDIQVEDLAKIDTKIKALIGKIVNQKAVEYNEYIDCEAAYLDILGEK